MSEIDSIIARITKKINAVYNSAADALRKQVAAFISGIRERVETIRNQIEAEEITQEAGKTALLRLFNSLSDEQIGEMTDTLYEANKTAKEDVNEALPEAYADGFNRELYGIEYDLNDDSGLIPLDAENYYDWMQEHPELFRIGEVDEQKDKDWNKNTIRNTLITAVLVGVATYKLTGYVTDTVINRNRESMQRNAEDTLYGGNDNGKQQAMTTAEEKGIQMKKEWRATLDFKTREAHRELDGVQVAIDRAFVYHGDEIRFPRDPEAPAYLRCNCRCAYRHVNPTWKKVAYRKENIKDEDGNKPIIKNMTYKEWFAEKQKQFGAEELEKQIKEMKRQQRHQYYERQKRRKKQQEKAS